jgi:hypothetical protein
VHDVLDRLRACARREAQLLFREQKRSPCPLPKASERVSHAINSVTDAVAAVLAGASAEQREEYTELLLPLFREHLPKVCCMQNTVTLHQALHTECYTQTRNLLVYKV